MRRVLAGLARVGRLAAYVGGVAACVGGLAACSSGGSSTATTGAATLPPSPSTAQPSIPTAAPTTRATATTAGRAPPTTVALIPQETPDLAAMALFTAWRNGDRHAALVVAVPSAVNAIFMLPAQDFSDRGCQTPLNGTASCAFGVGGQAAIAQVLTVSLAGGWVVQSVAVNGNT